MATLNYWLHKILATKINLFRMHYNFYVDLDFGFVMESNSNSDRISRLSLRHM
jgi:hypothetical protein